MFQLDFLAGVIRVVIVVSVLVRAFEYIFLYVVRIKFEDVTALMECNRFPALALAPAAKPRPMHPP